MATKKTALLVVLLLVAPLYAWRLGRPGFSDTEGMFAEPAREMIITADWVTPRMNGEPFLTKPPLMYWLSAAAMVVTGPSEMARVWPALAALGTVAVTGMIGAELFGLTAGVAAAVVLATSAGFLVEARLLRADMVLIFAVASALWCYLRLRRGAGTATAFGFWTAIAIGILDKGLLALVIPAAVIALDEILGGELRPRTVWARLRDLRAPFGILILLAVDLPWHLVAGARNPGFLWDYVVNQHVLFFFDRKLPRDSIPDSLRFFWAMFVFRMLPWSLLLPAALLHGSRAARTGTPFRLVGVWIAVVLGFFSLAASRLEHYSLPALPAGALAVGLLFSDAAAGRMLVGRVWLVAPPAIAAIVGLIGAVVGPAAVLAPLDPMLSGYGLERLVRPTAITLALGLGAFALLVAARRPRAALVAGAVTAALLFACVQIAHEQVEPLFSWRPLARAVPARVAPGTPIFFRASDEYQLCGGLDFYADTHLGLLAPPGWVPPTFLAGRVGSLFTSRAEFERAWHGGRAVLVSDDVTGPAEEAALVPGPYRVLARAGTRVALGPAVQSTVDGRDPSP